MFRRIDDFINAWTYEAQSTLKVLEAIPDAAAGTTVAEGHRDLRRLVWHLVESLIEMPSHWGIQVIAGENLIHGMAIVDPPATMSEIRATYQRAVESLREGLKTWTDATLEIEDDMYGHMWKRSFSLGCLLNHEIHHRGQMTVLMRQAGLKVPGVYGPAKEEWAACGMEPPRV